MKTLDTHEYTISIKRTNVNVGVSYRIEDDTCVITEPFFIDEGFLFNGITLNRGIILLDALCKRVSYLASSKKITNFKIYNRQSNISLSDNTIISVIKDVLEYNNVNSDTVEITIVSDAYNECDHLENVTALLSNMCEGSYGFNNFYDFPDQTLEHALFYVKLEDLDMSKVNFNTVVSYLKYYYQNCGFAAIDESSLKNIFDGEIELHHLMQLVDLANNECFRNVLSKTDCEVKLAEHSFEHAVGLKVINYYNKHVFKPGTKFYGSNLKLTSYRPLDEESYKKIYTVIGNNEGIESPFAEYINKGE